MSDGAIAAPSAFKPWQEEQPLRNSCRPSSIAAVRASAVMGVDVLASATENVVPIPKRAKIRRSGPAALWRRKRDRRFTFFLSLDQINSRE
jgi:hypothetical protein